jgi:hypothetical protein
VKLQHQSDNCALQSLWLHITTVTLHSADSPSCLRNCRSRCAVTPWREALREHPVRRVGGCDFALESFLHSYDNKLNIVSSAQHSQQAKLHAQGSAADLLSRDRAASTASVRKPLLATQTCPDKRTKRGCGTPKHVPGPQSISLLARSPLHNLTLEQQKRECMYAQTLQRWRAGPTSDAQV